MDPELRRLLQENLAVAKNNNEILRTMRHRQWLSFATSVVFWVVVVALPLYLYQRYVQPIFSGPSTSSSGSGGFSLPSSAELQKLLNSFKAGQNQ